MPFGNTPGGDDDEDDIDGEDVPDELRDGNGGIDEEKVEELIEKVDRLLTQQEEAPEVELDISDELERLIGTLETRQETVEARMSDLEDQMQQFQNNLENLLFGPEGAPSPLEDEQPEGDLWDVGSVKEVVDTRSEYEFYRIRAADDTDTVSPAFGPDYDGIQTSEDKMLTYFELFREGYASLKELYHIKLNDREWEMFVRELVDYHGITREMVESDIQNVELGSGIFLPYVDVIDPNASFFGFYTHGDELTVTVDECPIPLIRAFDDWYFADSLYNGQTGESQAVASDPFWDSLDLNEPEEYEVVQGLTFSAFNLNMATTIQTKSKYDAPDWMDDGGDFPGGGALDM